VLVWTPVRREVLLTHHRLMDMWLQLGGHLEPTDASLEAAAHREAVEESGLADLKLDPVPLRLTTHEVTCGSPRPPSLHLDVQYLASSLDGSEPRFGAESVDVRWFALDDLPEVDASVRSLLSAAVARLGC